MSPSGFQKSFCDSEVNPCSLCPDEGARALSPMVPRPRARADSLRPSCWSVGGGSASERAEIPLLNDEAPPPLLRELEPLPLPLPLAVPSLRRTGGSFQVHRSLSLSSPSPAA